MLRTPMLTIAHKDSLFLLFLAQLVLLENGVVIELLGVVDNLCGSHVHPIVQVTKEEEVSELVCQVKLGQLLLLEAAHPL